MTNILTAVEAGDVLRIASTDANITMLLPQIDGFIRNATGRDWSQDSPIHPAAKAAARMLLVKWHEDPGMSATGMASLGFGLTSALLQLEALAMRYFRFQGLSGVGCKTDSRSKCHKSFALE